MKKTNEVIVPWTKINYKTAKRINDFPKPDDLVFHLYLDYVKSGKNKTLMPNVLDISQQVVNAYSGHVNIVSFNDFKKKFEMSANREKRKEMEEMN